MLLYVPQVLFLFLSLSLYIYQYLNMHAFYFRWASPDTHVQLEAEECSKAEPARKGGASGASKPLAGAGAAITGAAKAKPKAGQWNMKHLPLGVLLVVDTGEWLRMDLWTLGCWCCMGEWVKTIQNVSRNQQTWVYRWFMLAKLVELSRVYGNTIGSTTLQPSW